jgi:hypothetical protein
MVPFSGEQLIVFEDSTYIIVRISVVDYRLFTVMCAQGGLMILEMKVLS